MAVEDQASHMDAQKDDGGLVCAYLIDGNGGAKPIGWNEVVSWTPSDGEIWVHLDYTQASAVTYLREQCGINPIAADALVAEDSRPRAMPFDEAVLVTLRGVNLNPGQRPEDMISIRCWIEKGRLITTRHRRLQSIDALRERLAGATKPKNVKDLFHLLADRLSARVDDAVRLIDETVDHLEEAALDDATASGRGLERQLGQMRRRAITLRRFLAPQREALGSLQSVIGPFTDRQRAHLREVVDHNLRILEDLDATRERAAVVQEELMHRASDQMNRNMYMLSVVAAIMLPLGFITGLLGINVGGLPLAHSGNGFWIVVGSLVFLVAIQVYIFRRRKWL